MAYISTFQRESIYVLVILKVYYAKITLYSHLQCT